MRSLLGLYDSHGILTIDGIDTDVNLVRRIIWKAPVTNPDSFHAFIDIGIDKNVQVKVISHIFPTVMVVEQVKAFTNDHLMLVAQELVLIFLRIANGVIKTGQGHLLVVTVPDAMQVSQQFVCVKRIGSATTINGSVGIGEFLQVGNGIVITILFCLRHNSRVRKGVS